MQHKAFHHVSELLAGHATYVEAYAEFLQTGNIPLSLEDIFRQQQLQATQETTQTQVTLLYAIHIYHAHKPCSIT